MANYRIYRGDEIFKLEEKKIDPIVEGLLYENDVVLIVAPPKMSKTVFAVQLACNISSGTAFLDILQTPQPQRVLYIATEMKDEELKDRFIRTSAHVKAVPDNITLVCTKGTALKLNTAVGKAMMNQLMAEIKDKPPKVIFIDSVYKAFQGSLKDDFPVNEFLTEVDRIAKELDAAVVLVHHLKKASRDQFNREFKANDSDTFGSQFLIGAADHVIRLEKIEKEHAPLDRWIRCDSQRTGNIITDMRIRLTEPDPLYFTVIDTNAGEKEAIRVLLTEKAKPMDISSMMKATGYSRSKMYHILKELADEGVIAKHQGKTKMYEIRKG